MSKLHVSVVFCVSLYILLLVMPAYALNLFKISNYSGGCQIWFETEAFDARDSDSENNVGIGFKIVEAETRIDLPKDAFGDGIVNVRGTNNIWLLYTFDVSAAEGEGGIWYLWARMVNPNNRSEWLWMLGDDGKEIPDGKPAFVDGDDRAFEATIGPPWGWASTKAEGDSKELQDGENTMMIWYREGDSSALRDVFVWSDTITYTPSDEDYRNAEDIKLSVESEGKLAKTWGGIKGEYLMERAKIVVE